MTTEEKDAVYTADLPDAAGNEQLIGVLEDGRIIARVSVANGDPEARNHTIRLLRALVNVQRRAETEVAS